MAEQPESRAPIEWARDRGPQDFPECGLVGSFNLKRWDGKHLQLSIATELGRFDFAVPNEGAMALMKALDDFRKDAGLPSPL